MHLLSEPPAAAQSLRGSQFQSRGHTTTGRVALAVECIGYLVPRADFAGRVHSVFAQACNIACEGTLLTLSAFGAGAGPTTLRLARDAPLDLRRLLEVGERIDGRDGCMRTDRIELQRQQTRIWWPTELRALLSPARIDAHLHNARQRLAQRRRSRTSVIDREGASVVRALCDACRALDSEQAVRRVDRLIGWGEGLTPAGDDFLIGLLCALDALRRGDALRGEFRDALAAGLTARTRSTTPIAAHYLRLAAGGHYTEPLACLRHALLCEDDDHAVDEALRNALAIGATSGADTVSGLLAGLAAWVPAAAAEAA